MEGDSDDEGTDSEFEWPWAALDRGRAMRASIEDHEERQRFVEEWVTQCSSSPLLVTPKLLNPSFFFGLNDVLPKSPLLVSRTDVFVRNASRRDQTTQD